MPTTLIRPMTAADVSAAERLSDEGFFELDVRLTRHLVETDPGGCWVAETDGTVGGFATSFVRETTWFLATYAVRPPLQGQGLGRALLAAALHHGRATLHGMLSSSGDPKAVRRYRAAGFDLHPQMLLTGPVDRSAIPVVSKVREGSAADIELLDSLDRQARGAAHGVDHELMLGSYRLLVSDTTTGSGYAYLSSRGVALLAASNRRTATRLLWAALAEGGSEQRIAHVTAVNQWAIDVGLAARLDLHHEGYLALRGMDPPAPYLHHGALL